MRMIDQDKANHAALGPWCALSLRNLRRDKDLHVVWSSYAAGCAG